MKPLQIPLEEGKYYHVFNRGNNGDILFYRNENYRFFLQRLEEYLLPYIDLYAYCLLPNHFHLLIRVKERREALHPEDAKLLRLQKDTGVRAGHAFHRLFTSYSKAVNNQENRHGSLIENPFKRKEVIDEQYFVNLVHYIHTNPQLHGICNDFRHYPWSSYERILSEKPSIVKKNEVIAWFGDVENFIAYHSQSIVIAKIRDLILD
jgi:putative transposase